MIIVDCLQASILPSRAQVKNLYLNRTIRQKNDEPDVEVGFLKIEDYQKMTIVTVLIDTFFEIFNPQ